MNSKELREKSLRIAHEARALLDTITDSNKAEVETQFDAMMADADALEARAAKVEASEERERAFAAADARTPAETTEARATEETDTRAKAFDRYLRGEISSRELRTASPQSVGTADHGGYLVPTTLANSLIVAMKAYGPMNEGGPATYITTASGNPLNFAKLDDTANMGSQISENTAAAETDLAFGQVQLGAYKYTSGVVLVSNELLQDSALDVQQIVADAMAIRMGRIRNLDLTTGSGSAKPHGIVTVAGTGVTAASGTAIAADELFDLQHSVDPAYRGNARWMLHDSTLQVIRKLKDGQGRYIWQPGLSSGVPGTILDHAYDINQACPTIALSAKTVLFGDMSKFYVRNVRGFALRRLDEVYAASDQVGFVGFMRFDGNILDSNAVKALVQAAS